MLQVISLSKSFGDKAAVEDVSFEIPAGQIVGYLGPNGAGKSTTVRMLTGMLKPDSGEVVVDGVQFNEDPIGVKQRLGYVPEVAEMYPTLTTNEYLSLVAELHAVDPPEARQRIQDLLQAFDVSDAANRQISQLSKGMRQKVLITSALLHDPKVLLLDEPLSGLDVNSVLAFRRLLEGLAARGTAILYCSHILDVVERLCERVILLRDGKVIADAPTKDLLESADEGTLEDVFRSMTGGDHSAEVADYLSALDGKP